eukprot:TRINITY_DN1026_c0_g1_i10.p1 TRINITY_DN1026_c0_g1~~TRINITY_DN1026_c0_g1_i10.p1  ORF type:complete len:194 (+),score=79.73 TRINITY_DN1026_c0_g1_i10:132-713(+)
MCIRDRYQRRVRGFSSESMALLRFCVVLAGVLAVCSGSEMVMGLDEMQQSLMEIDTRGSHTLADLDRLSQGKTKVTDPIGELAKQLEMSDSERRRVDAMMNVQDPQPGEAVSSSIANRAQLKREDALQSSLKAELTQRVDKLSKSSKVKPTGESTDSGDESDQGEEDDHGAKKAALVKQDGSSCSDCDGSVVF